MLESEFKSYIKDTLKSAIKDARREMSKAGFESYKRWALKEYGTQFDIKKLFKQIEAEYPWN